MLKGLLIMLAVFVVVAGIHVFSMRIARIPQEKKERYRKRFWIFYALYFICWGILNMLSKERFDWFDFGFVIIGVTYLILIFFKKLEA
jgi:hypothetical protein